MVLVAFADSPQALMHFCHVWGIQNPYTRAVTVHCAGCETLLPLACTSDLPIEDGDTKAYLIFELFARGWSVDHGKPFCPNCVQRIDL